MSENQRKSKHKVVMNDSEYEFLVARHPKFNWLDQENQFIYFLYIIRKEKKIVNKNGEKEIFNILCHIQMFLHYNSLMNSLRPILEEYILYDKKIDSFILAVGELALEDFEIEINKRISKMGNGLNDASGD